MPPEPALSLRGVRAGYGRSEVLRDVSIDVGAGQIVGLVGPNGSGKTTVVRVVSRALQPSAGSVLVMGEDPYAVGGRRAARLVAVVPQDVSPAFAYSALEIVMMGRSPHRGRFGSSSPGDWAAAREAMGQVGVGHLADRPVEELSGGERRRIFLAQALAQDAPVLVLDEPTTHLDIRHVVELLGLVREAAAARGKAVLAVLHDLTLASSLCDKIVVLERGEVRAEGAPSEVITADMLSRVYGVAADVGVSPTTGRPMVTLGPPARQAPRDGTRVHVIGGAGSAAGVLRALCEGGFRVSLGVAHGSDTDDTVAQSLNLERVTVPPFAAIDEGSASDVRKLLLAASAIIVCDAPFGPGNVSNLDLAVEAADAGGRVLLLERSPIRDRDLTGGRATELWEKLVALGSVYPNQDDLIASLRN